MLGDLVAVAACSLVVFTLASHYQLRRRVGEVDLHTGGKSDALVFSLAVLAVGLIIFISRRWRDSVRESEQAAAHRVDALVTTGDNVYPTGDPALYSSQLDVPYRLLRATRPLWATLGNHDVATGHGAAELAHMGLPPLPYEKDLPGAQLLFLDANHPDGAQASWLDRALRLPGPLFRIVVFHQPAWSCGPHGSTPGVDAAWVPIFEAHKVALVLNGHDHDYERFTSPAAVTSGVTGGGGQDTYPLVPCTGTPPRDAQAQKHHFTGIEVTARSLTLTAVGTDGAVIDRAVLTR